jgi:hypothetical protein
LQQHFNSISSCLSGTSSVHVTSGINSIANSFYLQRLQPRLNSVNSITTASAVTSAAFSIANLQTTSRARLQTWTVNVRWATVFSVLVCG